MRKLIFLILSFAPFIFIRAQWPDEMNFTLYTTKDGLSNNDIRSVAQDAYGYLWIATKKGLNRFDGNSFLQFYADGSYTGFPQDWIYGLKWLNTEELAAATLSGVQVINTRTLQRHTIYIPPDSLKNGSAVNTVQDVTADKDGNIFIITGTGFYELNKTGKLIFRYDHYNSKYAQTGWVNFGRNIIKGESNTLLLSTIGGLYVYRIDQKDLHAINTNDNWLYQEIAKPKEWFWFMHGDKSSFSVQPEGADNLFYYDIARQAKYTIKSPFKTADKLNWQSKIFRLNDTLLAINGKTKGFYLIHHDQKLGTYTLEPKVYFENYFCSSIFIDKNKRIWIGTNKGLFREKRLAGAIEKILVPDQWNPFNSDLDIRAVTISNNKIFSATANEGIIVFDRNSLKVSGKIDLSKYWKLDNEVYCMVSSDKDTVIAGIENSFVWINTKNLAHGKIDLPGVDSVKIEVNTLFKDSRDNIYAGINYIGRFYYREAKEKKFRLLDYRESDFFKIQVPMNINEDAEGNIWFVAAGACRYNYNQHLFDKFIDSVHVLAITFDKSGKMYL
ncbi:MAG TPA: two-component regulator propeller domain-containing protein, partial [Cytophaga sp.]|nr:two-component regulator propeller domain-containing protein [Cytophaga sp.]